VTDKKAQKVVY